MASMTIDEAHQWMLENRAIENACLKCSGFGVVAYGSTSTWRGGVGGQQITNDVCNRCWGTGDADRRGVSYREIAMWKAAYESANKKER